MKNKNAGWQRVLLLIIPYFIFVAIFQLIGASISGIAFENYGNSEFKVSSYQHMTMSLFSLLGTFVVLWFFMKFLDKEKFIQLGFSTKNRTKDISIGIILGAVIMIVGYFILILLDEIHFEKINFNINELIMSVATFTFVAIMEESLLRGYVLKNFMISFNKYIALIVSSLLFAIMHGANPNIDSFALLNLFLAGLLLGISYIYTKNLWFPIALHLSWNLFQTLVGFNVSGQDVYSIIEFSMFDKNRINGGDFGFEGSILAVITMITLTIYINNYYRLKQLK